MRAIIIVLDSVGAGELPDAKLYGDEGSNTLVNIKKKVPDLKLSNMVGLGLSHIEGLEVFAENQRASIEGCYGRMAEVSKGKDTTIGHWEIAGLNTEKPFPTYPNGFPMEVISAFERETGYKTIGNYPASGTKIIEDLGKEHVDTGKLIVYTSADSVFQIAAHEDIVPIDELYKICEKARSILKGDHAVARVIARPFITVDGVFTRTKNRKDFSVKPPKKTMLDFIKSNGYHVSAVGKIEDIFSGQGITDAVHIQDNMDGVDKTIDYIKSTQGKKGLIFTNLVDFDMLYGHRNDYEGYAKALKEFDNRLPEIISAMSTDDLLFITADHGCDPTTASTDHSREYVPLLIYGKDIKKGIDLKTRNTFADISATVLEYLGVEGDIYGTSFLKDILQ